MSILNIPTQITLESLAKTVAQLPVDTFEDFLSKVKQMRQQQSEETQLLAVIHWQLPAEQQKRFDSLQPKLTNKTLTPEEHTELEKLIRQIENHDVARAEALIQLAQKRGVSLRKVMHDLDLETHFDETD